MLLLPPMGATLQATVEQCCITVQHIGESGERTEEQSMALAHPADIQRIIGTLLDLVADGSVASFTVTVSPAPSF